MASASCGRSVLNSWTKSSKRACCCRLFIPGGRVASFFSVKCMRSWRPFCCGWPGLMRSMAMPSRSHHTESLERLKRPFGLANGTPLSDLIAWGRPRSWKSCSKAVMARFSRVDSRASQSRRKREAWSVTVSGKQYRPLPSLNSPLKSAHQRSFGAAPVDSSVPVARNADVAVQSTDQELADLAGTPMRLVTLGRDDQALDLRRQLIGIVNRPARAVGQGLETVFLIAL